MIRFATLCVFLFMPGCSIIGGGAGEAPSRYVYAAKSWAGASIQEMVAAWGTPNAGYKPSERGDSGIAGWDVYAKSGQDYRYRCTTFAYFDSDGFITRIVVRHSRFCDRRYDGQYGTMTRQEPRPGHSPIGT